MIINTREDLDAIQGTSEYEQFMQQLRGSLFIINRDPTTQEWGADENDEVITRFGLTRADFEPIAQPVLPTSKPDMVDQKTAQKVAEYKAYLNSTDRYYIRFMERGVVVPPEVVTLRAEYIAYIGDNEYE